MVYAGYSPGSTIADSLSPLQQALRSLPLESAQEVLDVVEKLTRNVVRNAGEEKFRRVKLSNAKLAALLADAPAMMSVMQEMGWQQDDQTLVLPPHVRLAHEVHVIAIIEAKDHFKKEAENERRRQLRAGKALDPEKEELRVKLEQDRKEKDAEGPVTSGSVAKKLGDGPNIMRAKDIGIGQAPAGG